MCMIRHELRQNMKSLWIWALTVGGFIFLVMLVYPEFGRSQGDLMEMYSQLGAFSDAFGLKRLSMDSALGFYGVEGGVILALGGSMFAAMTGTGMLAKEEGGHTAEFLYSAAQQRYTAVFGKLAAMVLLVTVFSLLCTVCGVLSFAAIGESFNSDLWLFHLAQWLMTLEIGCICFGISALLRKNSVGLGIGIAVLLYFANIFLNLSHKAGGLKYVTPFYYSDASRILADGRIEGFVLGIGIVIGAAVCAAGIKYYCGKDLAA